MHQRPIRPFLLSRSSLLFGPDTPSVSELWALFVSCKHSRDFSNIYKICHNMMFTGWRATIPCIMFTFNSVPTSFVFSFKRSLSLSVFCFWVMFPWIFFACLMCSFVDWVETHTHETGWKLSVHATNVNSLEFNFDRPLWFGYVSHLIWLFHETL